MDIIKYFFEEPFALEALSRPWDPDARRRNEPVGSLEDLLRTSRYYRGYFAGSRLEDKHIGITATSNPSAWSLPLVSIFVPELSWFRMQIKASTLSPVANARSALENPEHPELLMVASEPPDGGKARAALDETGRDRLQVIRELLQKSEALLFSEPAHHGCDWSIYSAHPIRERLTRSFHSSPAPGARRFILPYQMARSEEKFYFEFWQLDNLPDHIQEI